jgi:hypothetical protein
MTIIFEKDGKKLIYEPTFVEAPDPNYPGMNTVESGTLTIVDGAAEVSITLPNREIKRVANVMNQNF